eukprot:1143089-Pelagomonas_calceolata.AAC.15
MVYTCKMNRIKQMVNTCKMNKMKQRVYRGSHALHAREKPCPKALTAILFSTSYEKGNDKRPRQSKSPPPCNPRWRQRCSTARCRWLRRAGSRPWPSGGWWCGTKAGAAPRAGTWWSCKRDTRTSVEGSSGAGCHVGGRWKHDAVLGINKQWLLRNWHLQGSPLPRS